MAALGRLPPASGIAAMQSINIAVINPLFMAVLFGTGLVSFTLGFEALRHWGEDGSGLMLAAAICYVVGTLAVTMAFNVPLNSALAVVEPGTAIGHEAWSRYLDRWTLWNHARCVAALVACTPYISVLRLHAP